jgi:transposase
MAFDSDYEHVLMLQGRRRALDAAIEDMAADSEFTPVVRPVSCLRGVGTLTAFALAVEIGDWDRFTGNTIGAFVGLVPAEFSSGSTRAQGPITKTGNTHVRRLLVEAALASPIQVSGQGGDTVAVGAGSAGGPSSWSPRQPSFAQPMGGIPGAT